MCDSCEKETDRLLESGDNEAIRAYQLGVSRAGLVPWWPPGERWSYHSTEELQSRNTTPLLLAYGRGYAKTVREMNL